MSPRGEKRILQCLVAACGCVPVFAGAAGVVMAAGMVPGNTMTVPLDSHFRYLSGLLLGIGLAYWFMIPKIETYGVTVRILAFIIFVGGLARLFALGVRGVPDLPMQLALVMELVITPVLTVWQYRLSHKLGRT